MPDEMIFENFASMIHKELFRINIHNCKKSGILLRSEKIYDANCFQPTSWQLLFLPVESRTVCAASPRIIDSLARVFFCGGHQQKQNMKTENINGILKRICEMCFN